ncbi:MAG: hypothetical protein ACOC4D_02600, partial [Bacteroidota bacterium]
HLKRKAYIAVNGEFGWRKHDIPEVIKQCRVLDYAVTGLEPWILAVKHYDRKYDSVFDFYFQVDHIKKGTLPVNGSTKSFIWNEEMLPGESWEHYRERTLEGAYNAIELFNVESQVEGKYKDKIFYNLILFDEETYNSLKKY